MRNRLVMLIGVGLGLAALAGCDDQDAGKPPAKSGRVSLSRAVRAGEGWHNVADGKISSWAFAGAEDGPPAARPDPLGAIRAALDARMLPPRASVRIADLIGRVARAVPAAAPSARDGLAPGGADETGRVDTMVTTSPWNDNTWLMWVSVTGLTAAHLRAIDVAFDPKNIASFRPLGDADALPGPDAAGGRAQMLYELWPQPEGSLTAGAVYATLHVAGGPAAEAMDRPIGSANFLDSIDNATDLVRFATAVAGFAELLRGDPAVRDLSCAEMIALAESADQPDPDGIRAQMIDLMRRAEPLVDQPPGDPPQLSDQQAK